MELGSGEIVLILLVALLIYGGKLPQVAMALGRSLREFKRAMQETRDLVKSHVEAVEEIPRTVRRMPLDDLPEDEPLPEGWATEDVSGETLDDAVADAGDAAEDAGGGAPTAAEPDAAETREKPAD